MALHRLSPQYIWFSHDQSIRLQVKHDVFQPRRLCVCLCACAQMISWQEQTVAHFTNLMSPSRQSCFFPPGEIIFFQCKHPMEFGHLLLWKRIERRYILQRPKSTSPLGWDEVETWRRAVLVSWLGVRSGWEGSCHMGYRIITLHAYLVLSWQRAEQGWRMEHVERTLIGSL